MADAYEKYAVALAATGKADEAAERRREAGRIRETRPKYHLERSLLMVRSVRRNREV